MKKFMMICLVLCLLLGSAMPALAADGITSDTAVPLEVTYEAAVFSVTVPTVLPVSVDKDGKVSVSDNAHIINNSPAPIAVSTIKVEGIGAWAPRAWATGFTAGDFDKREFSLCFNSCGIEKDANTALFEAAGTGIGTVPSGESVRIEYQAAVPAQKQAFSGQIANIYFIVGWAAEV